MSNKVLEHIAKEYDSVRKGVKSVMGGKVLEYEAKTPNAATLCGTAYCNKKGAAGCVDRDSSIL